MTLVHFFFVNQPLFSQCPISVSIRIESIRLVFFHNAVVHFRRRPLGEDETVQPQKIPVNTITFLNLLGHTVVLNYIFNIFKFSCRWRFNSLINFNIDDHTPNIGWAQNELTEHEWLRVSPRTNRFQKRPLPCIHPRLL